MSTKYEVRYSSSPKEVKGMDTAELRENFLIQNLFEADQVKLTYSHFDRLIVGGIHPINQTVALETIDPLRADYFLERRELGIINVGGTGEVSVDGEKYSLDYKEALYVGRGNKEVQFSSKESNNAAKFYINSTPAHAAYPNKKVTKEEAEIVELGALETANHRVINKLLVNSVVDTCQLQMGMTELKTGSVWNTMPAHTHDRRMEAYFYFEVDEGQAVSHFMGQPEETRHIWLQNDEAVISAPWSIHAGSGTTNYTFIWGMGGENLDYDDKDERAITDLK